MNVQDAPTDPQILTALLRHFDWSPSSKVPGLYEVWTLEDFHDEEIIIPLDPARGDYGALLDRALRSVLVHYGRSARDVMDILEVRTNADLDSTQWEKEASLAAGIISWEQGEALYGSARAQLAASAKATREPRRYHGPSNYYLAKRFLEGSFMGQTDVGSFVITAYTPARQRFHVSKRSELVHVSRPRESETVTGRAIIDKFEQALTAVRTSLEIYRRKPQAEVFLEAVKDGVSFEFIRALTDFASGGTSSIRIDRPSVSGEAQRITEITFDPIDAPVLDRAAHVLAEDPEPQQVTLVGEVTLLSRDLDSPGSKAPDFQPRLIRLNIEEGAEIRRARVRLSAEQYEMAMEAHQHEARLRVSGRLEKDGQRWWLYDATNLAVVLAEERAESREFPSYVQGSLSLFDHEQD